MKVIPIKQIYIEANLREIALQAKQQTWCPEKVLIGQFPLDLHTYIILSMKHIAKETLFHQSALRMGVAPKISSFSDKSFTWFLAIVNTQAAKMNEMEDFVLDQVSF